jgi:hypothetical protein
MSQLQVTGEAKVRDIQGPVVANSGVITALDGGASQYVRGDGTLADFPTSTGGGSSVSYYLNSSVSQGTIGGVAYKQLGKTPIAGAGTDIVISTTGYVASYLTDANDPALLEVPAGNFNCEFYFSVNNNTGNPFTYAEVYKYDGTTFTLIGTSVGVPEYITEGTVINPYYFAVPVSQSVLTVTDRIAIRIYVNVAGRTVTLHTENNHLCQVVTTFSKGLISLNNLTRQNQFFATGTSGTDFNISSSTATHTFNIPDASSTNRGLITTGTQTIAGGKTFTSSFGTQFDYGIYSPLTSKFDQGIIFLKGTVPTIFSTITTNLYTESTSNNLVIQDQNSKAKLVFDNSTQTYTFPNASGTLALTSNLSSYVPYTGATTNVNLGSNNIFASFVYAEGAGGSSNGGILIKQYSGALAANSGYTSLFATPNQLGINFGGIYNTFLQSATLTASRTFTLPDLSGTLALLEAGTQTFTGTVNVLGSLGTKYGISIEKGNTPSPLSANDIFIYASSGATNIINFANSSYLTSFSFPTSTQTYTFPAASGTIALTSNLSSYVPYSGATGAVNLGAFDLTVNGLKVGRGGGGISTNTVLGTTALNSNTTGSENTALGWNSLQNNTTGVGNTGVGAGSLYQNTTGSSNTAIGYATLTANTTGTQNVAIGVGSLQNNTTANYNVAIGTSALSGNITGAYNTAIGDSTLSTQTTANNNTAIGSSALTANTSGTPNTAVGRLSLATNTTGGSNTAIGYQSLYLNTTGGGNTAIGVGSLQNNTTANSNTAIGSSALQNNSTGSQNTSIGTSALSLNTTANDNTAIGFAAMQNNTTGSSNSALGSNSLRLNTTGVNNTAIGFGALESNTTGACNTAIGTQSLQFNTTSNNNTAIGYNTLSITTGAGNTALGYSALSLNTTGSNNVAVGNGALISSTTSNNNTAIGVTSLTANTTGTQNTAIGINSGVNNTTGSGNSFIGYNAGAGITTGGGNTILGNAGTLSSSLSNNIILADGNGNIRYQWNGTNNVFGNPISGTSATFSSNVIANNNLSVIRSGSSVTTLGQSRYLNLNDYFGNTNARMEIGLGYSAASGITNVPAIIGYLQTSTSDFTKGDIYFATRDVTSDTAPTVRLTIASTGAATFSSSIDVSTTARFHSSSNWMQFQQNVLTSQNSDGAHIRSVVSADSAPTYSWAGDTDTGMYTPAANTIAFSTAAVERMRITSDGTVCMGRTSSPSSAYKLAVQEAVMMAVSTNGNNMVNFFNQSDGYVASIVVNASTVSYGTGSDYRLKEDLKDFNGLEKVSAIKVYDFKFKEEGDRMEGVIAHELQEVVPYAVTGFKDEKNNDGTDKIQNVDYSKIVPILVKSIQELEARIKQLENK